LSSEISVGLVQMSSGEDVSKNLESLKSRYLNVIQNHGQNGNSPLDLVVTPENTLFMRIRRSTPIRQFELKNPEILDLQKLVDQNQVPLLLGSIPLKGPHPQKVYNATVFLSPNLEPEVLYKKIHLFDVDVEGQPPVRESDVFLQGEKPQVWDFKGFKWGMSICYDLRFSELYHQYALQEADVLFVPAAFLVPTGEAHWEVLLRARAIESQCFCLAPAQGGRSEGADEAFRETYGHSLAVDPWGKVLIDLDSDNPTGVVKLERAKIKKVRRQIPMKGHRRI
tara:strand:- start:1598 stop:2440 length:843 start_codon:yes stop_codon:yes gene_type:complete